MSYSSHSIHIGDEEKLRLSTGLLGTGTHDLTLSVGDESFTLFVPPGRAHELSVLLNKAAVYFGSLDRSKVDRQTAWVRALDSAPCTCGPRSPDDGCPDHGFEAGQEEQARDAARANRDG